MKITLAIGVFFLLLATFFAFASRSDCLSSGHQRTPAANTRRRIAIIFAVVGLGLVLWQLTWN